MQLFLCLPNDVLANILETFLGGGGDNITKSGMFKFGSTCYQAHNLFKKLRTVQQFWKPFLQLILQQKKEKEAKTTMRTKNEEHVVFYYSFPYSSISRGFIKFFTPKNIELCDLSEFIPLPHSPPTANAKNTTPNTAYPPPSPTPQPRSEGRGGPRRETNEEKEEKEEEEEEDKVAKTNNSNAAAAPSSSSSSSSWMFGSTQRIEKLILNDKMDPQVINHIFQTTQFPNLKKIVFKDIAPYQYRVARNETTFLIPSSVLEIKVHTNALQRFRIVERAIQKDLLHVLHTLDFSHVNGKVITRAMLDGLSNLQCLRTISLWRHTAPAHIYFLPLTIIDLQHRYLKNATMAKRITKRLVHLERLNLNGPGVTNLDFADFVPLSKLTELHLRCQSIANLEVNLPLFGNALSTLTIEALDAVACQRTSSPSPLPRAHSSSSLFDYDDNGGSSAKIMCDEFDSDDEYEEECIAVTQLQNLTLQSNSLRKLTFTAFFGVSFQISHMPNLKELAFLRSDGQEKTKRDLFLSSYFSPTETQENEKAAWEKEEEDTPAGVVVMVTNALDRYTFDASFGQEHDLDTFAIPIVPLTKCAELKFNRSLHLEKCLLSGWLMSPHTQTYLEELTITKHSLANIGSRFFDNLNFPNLVKLSVYGIAQPEWVDAIQSTHMPALHTLCIHFSAEMLLGDVEDACQILTHMFVFRPCLSWLEVVWFHSRWDKLGPQHFFFFCREEEKREGLHHGDYFEILLPSNFHHNPKKINNNAHPHHNHNHNQDQEEVKETEGRVSEWGVVGGGSGGSSSNRTIVFVTHTPLKNKFRLKKEKLPSSALH